MYARAPELLRRIPDVPSRLALVPLGSKSNRVAGEVALPWLSHHRTYGSRITAVPQEEELA